MSAGEGGWDGPVDDNSAFLDDAPRANHDGPCNGKDGRLWVDDGACIDQVCEWSHE